MPYKHPCQKTHQKSAPISSDCGDHSKTLASQIHLGHQAPTEKSMSGNTSQNPTEQNCDWVNEPEAAKLLLIKKNTIRAMRRDGRLVPGDHYIFATGNLGGPVVYDIDAIRKTLAERTIAAVQEKDARRKADLERRIGLIETYGEEDHPKAGGE